MCFLLQSMLILHMKLLVQWFSNMYYNCTFILRDQIELLSTAHVVFKFLKSTSCFNPGWLSAAMMRSKQESMLEMLL